MKRYFVRYGNFQNSYALRYSDELNDVPGWDRITKTEAEQLAKEERQRRKDNPMFSGYADMEILPFNSSELTLARNGD